MLSKIPELETARLRLRGFRLEDLDDLCLVFGDPEVMRYISAGRPRPRDETQAGMLRTVEGFKNRGFGIWALVAKDSGRVIGYCGLTFLEDTPEIEVAYGLAQSHWGQGLATEAARASLKYGFEKLGLDRIVAVVNPQNIGSQHVLEKLGMRYAKDVYHYDTDLMYYELSRADYQAHSASDW